MVTPATTKLSNWVQLPFDSNEDMKMGLTDSERTVKLYYAVNEMRKLVDEYTKWHANDLLIRDDMKSIVSGVKKMWHAFLGGHSSGAMHWLVGSSSDQRLTTFDPSTPWEVALSERLSEVALPIRNEQTEQYGFSIHISDDSNDPENILDSIEIENLLTCGQRKYHHLVLTFKLYKCCERAVYALRRYDDDYRKALGKLDSLISDIMGLCFSVFIDEEDFSKAYVIREIAELIVGGHGSSYPWGDPFVPGEKNEKMWDAVTTLADRHLRHEFGRLMRWEFTDLVRVHLELGKAEQIGKKKKNDDLLFARMYVAIEVMKFTSESEVKAWEKVIRAYFQKKDADRYVKMMKARLAEYKAKKDTEFDFDEEYAEKQLNAYGNIGYSILNDALNERRK